MTHILVCELPDHLLETPLGRALLGNVERDAVGKDATVDIPDAYYCKTLDVSAVNTSAEFVRLLEMYRYWGPSWALTSHIFDVVHDKRDGSILFDDTWLEWFPELADNLLTQILFICNTKTLGKDFMDTVGRLGFLNIMRWAHNKGCPWDGRTCLLAAENGHLSCLQYAHEHGCPWNEYTCRMAAKNGHLNCLQYAHEHGCPWNEHTCADACYGGNVECIRYLYENGCPCHCKKLSLT